MKRQAIFWTTVAVIGAIAGATGSRLMASVGDMTQLADVPFGDFIFSVPALVFLAWLSAVTLKKHAIWFVYVLVFFGLYGTSYGMFELLFHSLNHRLVYSSLSLLLLGLTLLLSSYVATWLFSKRWREA